MKKVKPSIFNVLFLLVVILLFVCMPLLNRLQQGFNDTLMRKCVHHHYHSSIQIVYFDEQDIERLGGWPLSRNVYGYLIERLAALGTNIIAFDIYWPERLGHDENDLFLASVLQHHANVIGSFYFDQLGNSNVGDEAVPELTWDELQKRIDIHHASGIHVPDARFVTEKTKYGFSNLPLSLGGRIEESVLLLRCGDVVYPSFGYRIAQYYKQEMPQKIPANIRINYTVDSKNLPLISVREIIQPEHEDSLKMKLVNVIVLIGVISTQLGFEKPTPISPSMPVISIHAQIVDNLLSNNYLKAFPAWISIIILLLLVVGYMYIHRITLLKHLFILLCSLLCGIIVTLILWKHNIIFPLYTFSAGLISFFIVTAIYHAISHSRQFQEELLKRKVLEQEFKEKVQSASKLEQEYFALRQKYHSEIEDLRETLTTIGTKEAASLLNIYSDIICSDKSPMLRILAELKRIGETDEPVLITGESGTGKELIAKAIHRQSRRASFLFVAMNCGAIAENLLESELFGHEKGAFTGASQAKSGFFEAANQGTIFLDEITETSIAFQAKFLRVLQEGTFYRVGSTQTRKVNCRVIAATNQNIEACMHQGKFRHDLYFRLNVLPIHLPPLRERKEDIPLLLTHFLKDKSIRISSGAQQLLQSYHWPGNIRELQNIIARIKILENDTLITPDWIKNQLTFDKTDVNGQETLDERILNLYREFKFRNDANRKIAEALGHLHRSTITEYLKGLTFQFFYEANYNLEEAIRRFNPTLDSKLDSQVRNRMMKYLENLKNKLKSDLPVEKNLNRLQEQIRKMPKKYHSVTLEVAGAFLKGMWR